jgi:Electron transfer DM13
MPIRSAISRHPIVSATAALLVVCSAIFVLAYFEPQKLFIDDRVNEPLPTAPASLQSGPSSGTAHRSALKILSQGSFTSYEHASHGQARVIELARGERYLRFEAFSTSNGPDLRVYLSTTPATGPADAFDDDYIELGHLKGNIGNQNYVIPAGTELDRFKSTVVWCKRFSVAFGAAPVTVG